MKQSPCSCARNENEIREIRCKRLSATKGTMEHLLQSHCTVYKRPTTVIAISNVETDDCGCNYKESKSRVR